MQVPLAAFVEKVRCRAITTNSVSGIGGKFESDGLLALGGGEPDGRCLPVQGVGMQIVTRWTGEGLRAGSFASMLLPRDGRLDGFGGFLSCLDVKIGDEMGFAFVASGPFIRSSYNAIAFSEKVMKERLARMDQAVPAGS